MIQKRDMLAIAAAFLLALAIGGAVYLGQRSRGNDPLARAPLSPAVSATLTPTASSPPTATPPAATPTPTPTPVPGFGPVAFGTGVQGDAPLNPGVAFLQGTDVVYALWSYEHMASGTPYRIAWFHDGALWAEQALAWDGSQYGTEGGVYVAQVDHNTQSDSSTSEEPGSLPPGHYRLELFVGGRQVQIATFEVVIPTPTPLPPPPSPTPQPDPRQIGRQAARSLVKIAVPADSGEDTAGSGSIVDGDKGLILTNWHIVADKSGALLNEEGYAGILWTEDPDRTPSLIYMAKVLPEHSDPDLDLALLQITHHLEGPKTVAVQWPLDLPPIPLGDSDTVHLGDRVVVLGYPDYADGTVSWTEGQVVTHDGDWIRSDALASHGHSGGMMLDEQGQQIGIISEIEWIGWEGELSKARPANAARPLVEHAREQVEPPPPGPGPPGFRETQGELMTILGSADLSLRARPRQNSRSLGALPAGTTVEVLDAPEWDGEYFWYHVQPLDGTRSGWVRGETLIAWEAVVTPLLFTSAEAGSEDLYRVLPDGTGLDRLTDVPGNERDTSRSPDGDYAIFGYTGDQVSDLYVMYAEGGKPLLLTEDTAGDVQPAWSPDGHSIAFASDRDGDLEIYVLDLGTREVRQITSNEVWDGYPTWSPDSRHLAFVSSRTGNQDLFVVSVQNGEETQLTTNPHADTHPSWSPVGDEIAYTMVLSEAGSLRTEIGVLNIHELAQPRRVTVGESPEAMNHYPDWSPDGKWLVYLCTQNGQDLLCLVPVPGGPVIRLTGLPLPSHTTPAWSR